MRKIGKILSVKKDPKRVVYTAMDQKAREPVFGSFLDSCELFRIAKQMFGEKKGVAGVTCLKDENRAVKVSMVD